MTPPSFLDRNGTALAYRKREGKGPCIVWLGGFRSDMDGTKAEALDQWCAREGRAVLRFDYSGHGLSGGDFLGGTISRWRDDALFMLDRLADGPAVLVGSSMGGWIALLLARMRPERIKGMVLIAPAPDFTEELMWAEMPAAAKVELLEKGVWQRDSAYDHERYPITRVLIEDGRENLVLGAPIAAAFPVRILQGMADPDVPWRHAMRLVEAIEGDVRINLVKHGDHRLSTPDDLKLLEQTLSGLMEAM